MFGLMACRLAVASTLTVAAGFCASAQILVGGVIRQRKAQIRLALLDKGTPSTGLSLVLCGYRDISVSHRAGITVHLYHRFPRPDTGRRRWRRRVRPSIRRSARSLSTA